MLFAWARSQIGIGSSLRETSWDGELDGLSPGGKQHAVVGNPGSVKERNFPRTRVDRRDIRLETQIDIVFGIKAVRTQRHPILRCASGEIIFREVGPVEWRRVVIAQHQDAAPVFQAAKHFHSRKPGGAPSDNDDFLRRCAYCLSPLLWFCAGALLPHEDLPVLLINRPASYRLKAGADKASPVRRSKQA